LGGSYFIGPGVRNKKPDVRGAAALLYGLSGTFTQLILSLAFQEIATSNIRRIVAVPSA
jgi:hypothetical protein